MCHSRLDEVDTILCLEERCVGRLKQCGLGVLMCVKRREVWLDGSILLVFDSDPSHSVSRINSSKSLTLVIYKLWTKSFPEGK